jgi:hypothetical protein
VEHGLLFSLWIQSAKDPVATRLALEALAANQFTTFNNGGKVMVSASVAGKSFSYQMQQGTSPVDICRAAHRLWQQVETMTAEQLYNFLKKSTGSISYPQFTAEVY